MVARRLLFAIGVITALLVACATPNRRAPVATRTSKPVVLTTFTVLADLAQQVAGDRLEVRSITKLGAEVHGYEPTPSDLEGTQGASLIVQNGLGLERWADRFVSSAGSVPTVTLSDGLQPELIAGDVDAGQPNPHAWMSPRRTEHYVDRLVKAFSQLDPAGSASFRQRGEAYKQELRQLDQELRQALDQVPPDQRLLVSCEGAFTYLARDYGLDEAYLWPVNAETQVTPRRLSRLIDTVKQRRVPAVFCESTVSDEAQREVARATGARFGGTFFVDSLSDSSGPAPSLLALQRHNVGLIVKGLSGQGPQQ
ncbi:metal ABC transporter substrate-binding protein [Synechococcus sp. CBW1107]|uniref:metal ABC transporter substrate-binding protein n=1 Tax=Synechococcus sp. CBW1107 TaxID=2789857 RepID=UPI003088E6FE|nr:putative periplasmic iron-binding protein [Synechococcus sp. CBW1107]